MELTSNPDSSCGSTNQKGPCFNSLQTPTADTYGDDYGIERDDEYAWDQNIYWSA